MSRRYPRWLPNSMEEKKAFDLFMSVLPSYHRTRFRKYRNITFRGSDRHLWRIGPYGAERLQVCPTCGRTKRDDYYCEFGFHRKGRKVWVEYCYYIPRWDYVPSCDLLAGLYMHIKTNAKDLVMNHPYYN